MHTCIHVTTIYSTNNLGPAQTGGSGYAYCTPAPVLQVLNVEQRGVFRDASCHEDRYLYTHNDYVRQTSALNLIASISHWKILAPTWLIWRVSDNQDPPGASREAWVWKPSCSSARGAHFKGKKLNRTKQSVAYCILLFTMETWPKRHHSPCFLTNLKKQLTSIHSRRMLLSRFSTWWCVSR